ncbi:bifunctional folylpolyglutamate synthase/dihydrofolate synthase [Pseudohoeflea coraliihabitans]|uniref:Dihydrofolate synthase/folylpolyglutamate synthase n=1 Tax=Pseudohoeflea coraliihabitans TaxID=2860393 RepID=A0ABS6WT25_9HYPH|nr:folylpolyglutamate synthase/dihydrofolate synthase family protein [Pseudohoeflea sp. DP4N28-3]MBW3099100.1 bifunctional folylpolyglutamate synthase/dihydrofolate synthase [Pseudohoeflea sp. DP4N28-3]
MSRAALEIDALMALHPKGYDLSLDRIQQLLDRLDNPHRKMPPIIHIAGTNGKGSVSAFCRSMLEASGHRVHVHTSPHLVCWHERFRMAAEAGAEGGGQLVDDDLLCATIRRVAAANAGAAITVFEILTATMFVLFSEHPADVAIIEVGLGGRFDATNVIPGPAATLITPISLDHQAYLGDRVELIAAEKAGIIKAGCPVVIGEQLEAEARDVLIGTAERLRSPMAVYGQDFMAYGEHNRLIYQDEEELLDLPLPHLTGRHQFGNAAVAIRGLKAAGFLISEDAIGRGLASVAWPGRLQLLSTGPISEMAGPGAEIWIDGGHNPGAGRVVAEAMANAEERQSRELFVICGMLNTKEPRGFFEAFAGIAKHVFTVPIQSSEAGLDPVALASDAAEASLSAEPADTVEAALKAIATAWQRPDNPPRILICGSLYLVGEVLAANRTPPR